MTENSSVAIRHLVRALEAEISKQEALGRLPENEWSDDYDPNDIGIYRGMADYFRKPGAVIDHPESKSMQFTMALIPGYVQANLKDLSLEEWSALYQAYTRFVAAALHQIVVQRHVITGNFARDLNSIVDFPAWKRHEA